MTKKTFLFALAMAALTLGCQQKQQQPSAAADSDEPATDTPAFDISQYLDVMSDNPELRFNIGDYNLSEYALADIDGDGIDEVWVRDTTTNYLAIYCLSDDEPQLVAYADGCTDLEFYKNAVAYSAYYSPGRAFSGAQVLRHSQLAEYYWQEEEFDIFDDDQEEVYKTYYVNGEEATEADCDRIQEQLGEAVDAPTPRWMPIPAR